MNGVIVFGTNDISQLATFYLRRDSHWNPVAYCVDGDHLKESRLDGLPVVPFEEVELSYEPGKYQFFAPLYDNKLRQRKADEISAKRYNLISYVSSHAVVWSSVGDNCFVMEGNVIQPFVKVGNNVVLWSGNHIGHHSVIRDNVFFASHVVLSGHCEVGPYSWFGVNSTIRDHVKIAEGTFLCMGADMTHDTVPYRKYKGSPAEEVGYVD